VVEGEKLWSNLWSPTNTLREVALMMVFITYLCFGPSTRPLCVVLLWYIK